MTICSCGYPGPLWQECLTCKAREDAEPAHIDRVAELMSDGWRLYQFNDDLLVTVLKKGLKFRTIFQDCTERDGMHI